MITMLPPFTIQAFKSAFNIHCRKRLQPNLFSPFAIPYLNYISWIQIQAFRW